MFNGVLSDKKMFGADWIVRIVEDENTINAWTWGGKNLYITRGLMNILNDNEIMAVMLHEAGHSKEYHIWQRAAVREGGFALFMFTIVKALGGFDDNAETAMGLGAIAYFGWKIISPIVGIAQAYWSRVKEFWADSWATKHGYGKHLISSFKKMVKASGGGRAPCKSKICKWSRAIKDLYASHPDMQKRIERVLNSEEGKKAVRASGGNVNKALFSLAKASGATHNDVQQLYNEKSNNSFAEKAKTFFKKDIFSVFRR
jgi:Zn-dependent protease with chaperone function